MPSMKRDGTIRDLQEFTRQVYGKPNDLHFDLFAMLSNVERFAMRALKGIRKADREKTRKNLIISMSWFMSTLNRLHIDLEEEVWKRFPHLCSYCISCPCSCQETRPDGRGEAPRDESKRPKTIQGFQEMFGRVYPAGGRTLDHAGVHLAEELGEFSEILLAYRGEHKEEYLNMIALEAADVFSCFMGVFNSLGISLAEELSRMYAENCHECKKAPCECEFNFVLNYRS